MELNSEIGWRIKLAREKKGFSQQDLSSMLGVSREAIAKFETGERKINLELLKKISQVLQVDFFFLISGYTAENAAGMEIGLTNGSIESLKELASSGSDSSKNALAAVNVLLKNTLFLSLLGQYFRNDFGQEFIVDPGNNQLPITVSADQIKTASFPFVPVDIERSTRLSLLEYLRSIRENELSSSGSGSCSQEKEHK